MKATEVFTPTSTPTVTFIGTHLEKKATLLRNALEMGSVLISLIGPSKSGKTTFVQKSIGTDRLIHVTGAGITNSDMLWTRVFDITGTSIPTVATISTSKERGTSIGGTGGVNLGAKAEIETKLTAGSSESQSSSSERGIDYLQLFIRDVKASDFILFIDDFHYINPVLQSSIAEQLKEAVRQGLTVITAAVPYHSDDVVRANTDLSGRFVKIDFEYWRENDLLEIAKRGFGELNIQMPSEFCHSFAMEAAGSPQLMQALCLNACFHFEVRETRASTTAFHSSETDLSNVCEQTAFMTDFSSALAKMNEGPKTRGKERTSHQVKGGPIEDVYPIVLRAIKSNPPLLTLRYNDLKARVESICAEASPTGSSITSACLHIAKIANDHQNMTVIEWDAVNEVLDIREPYLLFYMRWA